MKSILKLVSTSVAVLLVTLVTAQTVKTKTYSTGSSVYSGTGSSANLSLNFSSSDFSTEDSITDVEVTVQWRATYYWYNTNYNYQNDPSINGAYMSIKSPDNTTASLFHR